MNKLFRTLMIATLVIGTACTSQAQQDDKDKKITIHITKEVDGETKTFKGEYRNEEEMRNDPAFQEFAGDDTNVFFFNEEGEGDRFIELHSGSGSRAFSFGFDDEDFPHRIHKNFQFGHGGPGAFFFGDDDVIGLRGWNSEEFEAELEEKMKVLEEKLKDLDKDLQEDIMEALKDIESIHSEKGFPKRIHRGGVSISDVENDFGKRGKVDEKNKLDLDANYMIHGKRMTLRFRTPKEGELTVKISNESGKDIYNRYFESFGGTFSDQVDFAKYSEGKYLMEIELDGKRLTKKIVID